MKLLITCPMFLAVLIASPSFAGQDESAPRPALEHYNLGKKGLAIDGYDPVAYFPLHGGKAKEGSKSLTHTYHGVTYRFASPENRAVFIASPERFEPAYGGWCAYAMVDGDKVEIDQESFVIQNGRLLLFYKSFWANTRKKWLKADPIELEKEADRYWRRISGEGAARDTRHFNLKDGLALRGYDPVSYFATDGSRPMKGKPDLSTEFKDVVYRFASAKNRLAFLASPESFEPAYGGFCAWAMAHGKKVEIDPEVYTIEGGTLLLFENASKRDEWKQAASKAKKDADREWKKLHAR